MKRPLVAYCLVLACAGTVALAAKPAPDPTFDAALSEAYLYNPQLLVERQRLRESDEGVAKAVSGWRPQVNFAGDAGSSAVDDNTDKAHRPERRIPQQAALNFVQPLYTGGKVPAEIGQADALVQAQRAMLQATEATVLLAAATAFVDVARDQRLVQLNRNQAMVLERTLRASEQEYAAGSVTLADVAQARARSADQGAALAQADTALTVSRSRFEQSVGRAPGELRLPVLALKLPGSLANALLLAPNDFDVLQSRAAQEASRQGIDIARAGLLPRISVMLAATRVRETDVQQAHQRDNIAEATIQLTIPIYQGGAQFAEIRQAKEAAARSLLQVDVVLRQARMQVQAAWAQLEGARIRQAKYHVSLDANLVAERGVARQQSVGARTLLDVLNAQQERLASEVNGVTAERDAAVAALQLQAATGQLSATSLGLHVPIYDPAEHYLGTRGRWYGTTPAP